MLTYKDTDINNAILSISEDVNNPRFLDILQKCHTNLNNKITIKITIEGEENSECIQFNRTIKGINQFIREVNVPDKGITTITDIEFDLK
jgi:hypothetical protein